MAVSCILGRRHDLLLSEETISVLISEVNREIDESDVEGFHDAEFAPELEIFLPRPTGCRRIHRGPLAPQPIDAASVNAAGVGSDISLADLGGDRSPLRAPRIPYVPHAAGAMAGGEMFLGEPKSDLDAPPSSPIFTSLPRHEDQFC